MFVAVLVRRLRPGVTFEAFIEAWRAEPNHFGEAVRVTHARRIDNPREIVSYAHIDVDRATLDAVLSRTVTGERARHDRLAPLLESTLVSAIYEVAGTYELS